MRIAFLTQYYPPELGAPQARLSELATYFVERGHEMHVLTAMPSYPIGRVFDGYGGLFKREHVGGVDVARSWVYPSNSPRVAPRLASYASFAGSSALVGIAALPTLDYLLVESPPLFLGVTGMALARAKRARMIFNVSDLWPESVARIGAVSRENPAYRAAERLEVACYRRAWLVSGQSKSILEGVKERCAIAATYHLSNGCDSRRYGRGFASADVRRRLDPSGDSFVFVYAGLHGLAQGLDQILDIAARLRDTSHRFVLVGDGPDKKRLVERARQERLDRVAFLDPVPAREVPPLLASADAILVTLGMEIPGAVPSKIYEAMASERAVVLVAAGEAAEIVERSEGGITVRPGDVEGLAKAVERIRTDAALRTRFERDGRRAVLAHYDRPAIAGRFIDHLESQIS